MSLKPLSHEVTSFFGGTARVASYERGLSLSLYKTVIFLRCKVGSTYTCFVSEIATYKFAFNLLTFFILFNNLIPISLQVTVEVVRFMQVSLTVVFIRFIMFIIFVYFCFFYLGNVH